MTCSCKPKMDELESKVAALEYAFIMVTGKTPKPVKPMSVPGDAVELPVEQLVKQLVNPRKVAWPYLDNLEQSASEEDWQVNRSCCQD